nr:LuxR C-terminal-related transcriptional regulator [Streptomyces sp. S063]
MRGEERAGPCPLTDKEAGALRPAAGGAHSREIAAELFLSVGTVRNRLSSAVGGFTPVCSSLPSGSPRTRAGCRPRSHRRTHGPL